MKKIFIIALYTLSIVDSAFPMEADLKGHYKNLLIFTKTISNNKSVYQNLNRLELEMKLNINNRLKGIMVYDIESSLGSMLKTEEFRLVKESNQENFFDLEKIIIEDDNLFLKHLLYRIYFVYSIPKVDITIGRQRVAWGTGLTFNPTDIFNPIQPTIIEQDRRDGIDGINLEISPTNLSKVNIIYAIYKNSEKGIAMLSQMNLKDYDISLLIGELKKDDIIGITFVTNIDEGILRAEIIYTKKEKGVDFFKFAIGGDYTFRNSLRIKGEYFYNGQGEKRKINYPRLLLKNETMYLAQNYSLIGIGYDITPLLKFDTYLILNLDDNSYYINPEFNYSFKTNIVLSAGIGYFDGERESEFERRKNSGYVYIKRWF